MLTCLPVHVPRWASERGDTQLLQFGMPGLRAPAMRRVSVGVAPGGLASLTTTCWDSFYAFDTHKKGLTAPLRICCMSRRRRCCIQEFKTLVHPLGGRILLWQLLPFRPLVGDGLLFLVQFLVTLEIPWLGVSSHDRVPTVLFVFFFSFFFGGGGGLILFSVCFFFIFCLFSLCSLFTFSLFSVWYLFIFWHFGAESGADR